MQPSLTQPPVSGDETANPLATTLPPLSPELPPREQEPAPPITETPPKDKAKAAGILLPKALVDDLYREARKNFALIPDMTFALAAGSRALRDMWEHKDGKFVRKERPFANYIPPKDDESGAMLTKPKTETETPAVAAARARWDEAKREGDPDRMTRTANDLLRVSEGERQSRNPLSRDPDDLFAPGRGERDTDEQKSEVTGTELVEDGRNDTEITNFQSQQLDGSYYHPDFTDPLDVVFSRRRRRRSPA